MVQVTKKCPKCAEVKDVGEFSGHSSYCRPCWNEYAREYREKNRDRVRGYQRAHHASRSEESKRRTNRIQALKRFNLTEDAWSNLFEGQGRRCAICRVDTPTGHGWHVDHDHVCCPENGRSCGKCVRAILCSECNTGLGKFRDNPAVLRAAAEYLERVKGI